MRIASTRCVRAAVTSAVIGCLGVAVCAQASARSHLVPDRSFGNRSLATAPLGPAKWSAEVGSHAVLRDLHGRIILGAASGYQWQLRRYLKNGSLDTSFGENGEVVFSTWGNYSGGLWATLTSAAMRPDGRILLIGYVHSGRKGSRISFETSYLAMAQLMPDGSPDLSFGNKDGGKAVHFAGIKATSVALQKNGRFVVTGVTNNYKTGPGQDGVVRRFMPDGKIDYSFAKSGLRFVPSKGRLNSYLTDVKVISGGKILVGGTRANRNVVLRLKRDGSFDRTFSGNGQTVIDADRHKCQCGEGRAIARDSKGRIVVAGDVSPPNLENPIYATTIRLKRNGRLDRSFARRGIARLSLGNSTKLRDVAIDSRNRILVTGSKENKKGRERALTARYRPSGKLDRHFFSNGRLITSPGKSSEASRVLVPKGRHVYIVGRWQKGQKEFSFLRRLVWRHSGRG